MSNSVLLTTAFGASCQIAQSRAHSPLFLTIHDFTPAFNVRPGWPLEKVVEHFADCSYALFGAFSEVSPLLAENTSIILGQESHKAQGRSQR